MSDIATHRRGRLKSCHKLGQSTEYGAWVVDSTPTSHSVRTVRGDSKRHRAGRCPERSYTYPVIAARILSLRGVSAVS